MRPILVLIAAAALGGGIWLCSTLRAPRPAPSPAPATPASERVAVLDLRSPTEPTLADPDPALEARAEAALVRQRAAGADESPEDRTAPSDSRPLVRDDSAASQVSLAAGARILGVVRDG